MQKTLFDEKHLDTSALMTGVELIRQSPKDNGVIEMIVCRPKTEQRKIIEQGELSLEFGLVGDNWLARGNRKTPDGKAHPEMQLNIMNSRAVNLIAGEKQRWPLAGDQFYVDLDLSYDNLPVGTQLQLGSAVIEVTAEPHLGCKKFSERFGRDAALFVNTDLGKSLNLRGINAKVIQPGVVNTGDVLSKII